ncbi:MAG TPA: hypothetical protein VGH38_06315, partial [Bryobacteraceae bacterium]
MFEHTHKRGSGSPAQDWKPLVICPNAKMGLEVRSALSERGIEDVCFVAEYPPPGDVPRLITRNASNLCFLDVASNPEQALMLVGEAAATVPVVALNPLNDADLILRCLRRGATEFLANATAEQVNAVLERLARLHAPAAPQKMSKAYCVIPGKAGCGASTVAAYLAMELKRGGMSKVLLVDTDSITASVSFFFKLKSDFHLGDAVRDWSRMDDDLWNRLTVPYQGVDILLAPQNPTTAMDIDRQSASELLVFWRRHYEAIVMDLSGANSAAIAFAAMCDEVLMVTTNELAALHATKRSMECLEKLNVDKNHLKLVVTRYTPSTGLKREDVHTALKLEPWALLSNDYEGVQAALLEGKPVASG